MTASYQDRWWANKSQKGRWKIWGETGVLHGSVQSWSHSSLCRHILLLSAAQLCLMRLTAFAFLRRMSTGKPERIQVVWILVDKSYKRNTSEVPLLWGQPLQWGSMLLAFMKLLSDPPSLTMAPNWSLQACFHDLIVNHWSKHFSAHQPPVAEQNAAQQSTCCLDKDALQPHASL